MVRDITYCANEDCPFVDCIRNLKQLSGEHESIIISLANFGGVCKQYISYLVGDLNNIQYDDTTYLTEE